LNSILFSTKKTTTLLQYFKRGCIDQMVCSKTFKMHFHRALRISITLDGHFVLNPTPLLTKTNKKKLFEINQKKERHFHFSFEFSARILKVFTMLIFSQKQNKKSKIKLQFKKKRRLGLWN